MRKRILLSTLILALGLGVKSVFAQKLSLSISPPLLEVQIQPGKSITQAYQITNNSDTELVLKTQVVPFEAADEEGGIRFKKVFEPQVEFSLQNADLRLGQTFVLLPQQSRQLVLKIFVSKNALEKDEYYTFLIEQPPGVLLGERNTSRSLIKIGSHILISISQSEKVAKEGLVGKFQAKPKIADIFSNVNFEMIAENTGNRYFKPEANLTISNWRGREVKKIKIRPDNILAFSKRKLSCWLPPKEDKPPKTIDCRFSSKIPGRYQAVLSFKPLESDQHPQTYVVYFWILPIRIVVFLLVVLFFVLVAKKLRRANQIR